MAEDGTRIDDGIEAYPANTQDLSSYRDAPRYRPSPTLPLALSLLFAAGCQPMMTTPASNQASAPQTERNDAAATWPLKFKFYNFGASCFDTQTCSIRYNNFEFGTEEPSFSTSSLAPGIYDRLMTAHYGPLPLTLPPAQVRWRSKNGTALQAEVDIAEIFKDGLVYHKIPREEVDETGGHGDPHILLEVDDRTINVYSRTRVPTKHLQDPSNPYSGARDDLIKVYSKTY